MAVNNLTKVQNLQGCESLAKLDLSVNFIPLAGLLSLASLQTNEALRELHLLGNPCSKWARYRSYVTALLPQLRQLVRLRSIPCTGAGMAHLLQQPSGAVLGAGTACLAWCLQVRLCQDLVHLLARRRHCRSSQGCWAAEHTSSGHVCRPGRQGDQPHGAHPGAPGLGGQR